jgi:cytochrome P450
MTHVQQQGQRREIPRVPGLPIIGNLLDYRENRAELALRVPRELGEIARLRIGFLPVVMISSPELVREVLVDKQESFTKAPGLSFFGRPLLGNGLLTSERDFHKKQRRMMSPMFMQKRIAAYADVMAARAEKMAASFREGANIDVSREMMELTLEIVGKTLFDAEVGNEAEEIGAALTATMEHIIQSINSLIPIPPTWPTRRNARNKKAIARLDETIYRIIAQRRASKEEKGDLLSMLLLARDEADPQSGMDDKQVRDEAMTLFLAGHETTANALAWAWYLVAQHPYVATRLQEEADSVLGGRTPALEDLARLPYAMQVFKEAMRLYPPAYIVGRMTAEPVTIGGHPISRRTVVVVSIIGMHRRAEYFPEPDRFDPDRFSAEREKLIPRHAFLPFGAGPRVCIGNHFALMEGQIILATMAQRLRFELTSSRAVDPEPLITLRPRGGIPMRVRRRHASA